MPCAPAPASPSPAGDDVRPFFCSGPQVLATVPSRKVEDLEEAAEAGREGASGAAAEGEAGREGRRQPGSSRRRGNRWLARWRRSAGDPASGASAAPSSLHIWRALAAILLLAPWAGMPAPWRKAPNPLLWLPCLSRTRPRGLLPRRRHPAPAGEEAGGQSLGPVCLHLLPGGFCLLCLGTRHAHAGPGVHAVVRRSG